jgi:hypothetical protein
VIALAPSDIVEEQVQVGENIGEASMADVDKIVVNLEKNYFDDRRTRKCSSYSNARTRKCK